MLGMEETSVTYLSLRSKVHRRNVYDALGKLMDKGLASEVFLHGRKCYRAVNPTRLVDILVEKEQKVNSSMADLQKSFGHGTTEETAYMYKGIEGFKNYLNIVVIGIFALYPLVYSHIWRNRYYWGIWIV